MKAKTSLFITTLLLIGLLVPLLTASMAHAEGPPPGQLPGCCTTESNGGQCIGCPEGETCIASLDFCEAEGGFFEKGACAIDEAGGGAVCDSPTEKVGCCVIEPGSCINDLDADTCFIESPDTELWVSGASCSIVPQCTPTRNIPTMSNWGLYVLAAIFVLVGVWAISRKKSEA